MRKILHFFCVLMLLLVGQSALHAQPQVASPEVLVKPVLAKISAGKETPEQAWQAGDLNAELVLAALGSWQLVDAGIALPRGNMKLARGLAQTLIAHQPKILERPAGLPSRALLHLANVLGGQGDARAVALYEEVLSRQEKRNPIWPDEVDAGLYNLADYYERTGNLDKAIATKMRIYEYTTFPSLLANFEVQIGRLYSQKGDEKQSAQWYEAAEARKTPRAMGVARMDRAEALFNQGKTAEARALLLELAQKPKNSRFKSRCGRVWRSRISPRAIWKPRENTS